MSLFKWYKVPFALGWDEWDEWHAETRRKHPVQHFLRWTLPIWWTRTINWLIKDPWYKLKCRVWHRYNVVVCQGLPATWCDRDDLLLHAAFQCLTDFIEKEKPWEFSATQAEVAAAYDEVYDSYYGPVDDRRSTAWASIKELYIWWLGRRDDYEDHDEDDANLHKLIDLRGYFWT